MHTERWGRGALLLASFVFWLISFPMQGFLLRTGGNNVGFSFFLFPHILSLFLVPRLLNAARFNAVSKVAAIATAIFSLLFYFVPGSGQVLLPLIGIVSVVPFFDALELIRKSTRPALSAAVGIAAGNLFVFLLALAPIDYGYKFFLITIPLFSPIFFDYYPAPATLKKRIPAGHLLLLFLYYLTGGLLYGFLMPLYVKSALFPGGELLFYIATAAVAPFLFRGTTDRILAAGIFLGAISFTLVQINSPLTVNMGMFASQASFALTDLFMVLFVIGIGSLTAYGIGFGTVCLAIGAGEMLCKWAESYTQFLAGAGNVTLIGAAIALYLFGKNWREQGEPQPGRPGPEGEPLPKIDKARLAAILKRIYEPHQKQLSPKELNVLLLVLENKPYREVGGALSISESSVKTYVRRICEKLGTEGKASSVEKIAKMHRLIHQEQRYGTSGQAPTYKGSLNN